MKRFLPLVVLLAGCGPSFDASTLADRVGRTYAHLYERALEQAGETEADRLRVLTVCARGGEETPDRGPADDWRCRVEDLRPFGRPPVTYEVVLKPDGCFTAEGPPAVVGDARVTDAHGVSRLNPLYAFDGCL